MKDNTFKEIKIGGMIVLGLVIVFAAFFIIGGKDGLFSKRYELYARFDNVGGLTVGAPVRLGGMKVGTVDNINFSEIADEKAIIVKMSITSKNFTRLREDSKAKLGSMGLLGDKTVEISIGSMDQKPISPGQFIVSESGHTIEDIEATAQNTREISQKVNYGEGSLAKIINDPRLYTNLDSLLIIWADISKKINEGQGNLAALMNDPALYNNLTEFFSQSSVFIEKINLGEGSLGKLTKDANLYTHADSMLVSLNNTLEMINSGNGTIGQLVDNNELYMKLCSTLNSLDSLLVDIKQNPKKYVKLSLF